jgi:hypothetical protein
MVIVSSRLTDDTSICKCDRMVNFLAKALAPTVDCGPVHRVYVTTLERLSRE